MQDYLKGKAMKIRITPHPLAGTIRAISSKSATHRELICAALSSRKSKVACTSISDDIHATIECLEALGAKITENDAYLSVQPIDRENLPKMPVMNTKASGTTLRFIVPIITVLGCGAEIHMDEGLSHRPMQPLLHCLSEHGGSFHWAEQKVLIIYPRPDITGGEFTIPGDQTSQFISGLMFALPLLKQEPGEEDPFITVVGTFESRGYVEMTRSVLARAGIDMGISARSRGCIQIRFQSDRGYRRYDVPEKLETEGDWSNAAFWIVGSVLSGGDTIKVEGLNEESEQGDACIERMAREVISAARGNARIVDIRNIPDLMPVLAVLSACNNCETLFTGGTRLRIKETDRLKTTSAMLQNFGIDLEVTEENLKVKAHGRRLHGNCTIDSFGDHRIAMSAAIGAIYADGPVIVERAEAVAKSYPGFWEDYAALGGKIEFL